MSKMVRKKVKGAAACSLKAPKGSVPKRRSRSEG